MLGHADMLTMGCPQEVTLLVLVKTFLLGFPGGSVVRNPPANVGDAGSIPGLRRCPGEGNGNPLQYSCLENPMDRGAWQATVHEIAKSQTQLSTTTSTKDTACCNLDLVQPNFKKKRKGILAIMMPAMKESWVQALGWGDPLEDGMATHSSILAWRIPQTEEPGGLQSTGLQRVRQN